MIAPSRAAALEALLFSEGGPLARKKARSLLAWAEGELAEAALELRRTLEGRGITLIETASELGLATAPDQSAIIKKVLEEEFSRSIGDAGLEVLAIVLYRGPSTRAHIDYIRGVNTASTLRGLLARGLLERTGNPEDAREYLYRPTVELLAYLGVSDVRELPEYEKLTGELAKFEHSGEKGEETFADDDRPGEA